MELKAEKITRQYFRKTKDSNVFLALHETDLLLKSGTLTEITGRSGSGKSTLLNVLAGLLTPTAGTVYWDGVDIYGLEDSERSRLRNASVGVIPQGQTGLHALTVLENVKLPCLMYGAPVSDEAALALLEQVGIVDLQNEYPSGLSGGELRRLAIARALIRKPGMILADEPTGDLDDENTREVLTLLRKQADLGAAVLLVTHEREAAAYANKVYRMNGGILEEAQS